MNTGEKWAWNKTVNLNIKNQSKAENKGKYLEPKIKNYKEGEKKIIQKSWRKQSRVAGNGYTTNEGKDSDMNVMSSHIPHKM